MDCLDPASARGSVTVQLVIEVGDRPPEFSEATHHSLRVLLNTQALEAYTG